jgi:hypothetical protein
MYIPTSLERMFNYTLLVIVHLLTFGSKAANEVSFSNADFAIFLLVFFHFREMRAASPNFMLNSLNKQLGGRIDFYECMLN